jgi:hypothetical protein
LSYFALPQVTSYLHIMAVTQLEPDVLDVLYARYVVDKADMEAWLAAFYKQSHPEFTDFGVKVYGRAVLVLIAS